PRAQLGLVTALRRQLSPDVDEITGLIADTRQRFADLREHPAYPIEDFDAQLDAVEGVLCRQLGDGEAAVSHLSQAADGGRGLSVNYYLFWHPEHMEGHRALACLTTPGLGGQGRHVAGQLLRRTDADAWGRAAALTAVLHSEFADLTW